MSEGSKYLVHASYLEIYNEEIRDLLGKDVKQKLDLKEHPDKGVYVQSTTCILPCKNTNCCQPQIMNANALFCHKILLYLQMSVW